MLSSDLDAKDFLTSLQIKFYLAVLNCNKLVYIYTDGQVNSDNDIEKIWLSYKEGVIQYQYHSGEVFELY